MNNREEAAVEGRGGRAGPGDQESMTASSLQVGAQVIVAAGDFQHLLDALAGRGYQVMGPTLVDGQLIYGEIGKVTDLPGRLDGDPGGRELPPGKAAGSGLVRLRGGAAVVEAVSPAAAPDPVAGPTGGQWFPHHPPDRRSPQIRLRGGQGLRTQCHGGAGPGFS